MGFVRCFDKLYAEKVMRAHGRPWSKMSFAQRTQYGHVAEDMRDEARLANRSRVAELVQEIESARSERAELVTGGSIALRVNRRRLSKSAFRELDISSSSVRGPMLRLRSVARRTA